MSSLSTKFYAVISGAGPGVGHSTALLFSKAYPVVLLSRTLKSSQATVDAINSQGGQAIGIAADATDQAAMKAAMDKVGKELPGKSCVAAVFNANAGFAMKPFLDLKLEDIETGLDTAAKGLFLFSQATLPSLLHSTTQSPPHPPSLIVTGATASLRGSAKFGTFAAGKFAQRGLTQSLAREFGPQGVHVALAVIDGGINTPAARERGWGDGKEDALISPDAVSSLPLLGNTDSTSRYLKETLT
ncbi:hypothetical protein Golomagni_07923, partial [Golovinomyces magnicellulatus]